MLSQLLAFLRVSFCNVGLCQLAACGVLAWFGWLVGFGRLHSIKERLSGVALVEVFLLGRFTGGWMDGCMEMDGAGSVWRCL